MATVGIINDASASVRPDQLEAMIEIADRYGLKILLVGQDCDMESELMEGLKLSEKFTIIRQFDIADKPHRIVQNQGDGPRNRWGALR